MTGGTARRNLLRGSLLSGAALLSTACSSSAVEPRPTPTPSGSPSTPTRVDGSPTLPEGLQESQRTAYSYGDHPRQVCDLWLPTGDRRDGLVVLVHGGGWGIGTDRSDVDALVADLVGLGFPVMNTDYRGVGEGGGGGWTSTFTDMGTALDQVALAERDQGVDASRTLLLGHSAGGHLAMWAAARHRLPSGAPGSDPFVVPAFAGSMSGVLHPTTLAASDPNVVNVFGGTPEQVDTHYAIGDPARLTPLGMPLFVIHGTGDGTVPFSQSQEFTDLATAAGDTVDLQLFDGADHVEPLDPTRAMWSAARTWIETSLA